MKLVVDANILFSALIKRGKTAELFINSDFELFAPEFLFEEFEKYSNLLLMKTDKNILEFESVFSIFKKRIVLISNSEFSSFIPSANSFCPDKFDVDYLALALMLNCAIWSQDKLLKEKQKVITIYSTEDLLKIYR